MSHWHSLVKLRMHNDLTLDVMDAVAISLGNSLRHFSQVTSTAFETRELGREYSARMRRKARAAANKATQAANHTHSTSTPAVAGPSTATLSSSESNRPADYTDPAFKPARKRVKFNMNTYKAHSFPDYVNTIRRFGTTDSYSTELVSQAFSVVRYVFHCALSQGELEHRNPKSRYTRTNRRGFMKQMTQIERRQVRLRRIRAKHRMNGSSGAEVLPVTLEAHHSIGVSQNLPENISHLLQRNSNDPAMKVESSHSSWLVDLLSNFQGFIPKLKAHLLSRLKSDSGIDNVAEQDQLYFQGDRIYRHNIANFNYTTYDVRRSQDVINPQTEHCDIMLLSQLSNNQGHSADSGRMLEHPFIYARVLGIYHANVVVKSTGSQIYTPNRLEFLFVRWFAYQGTSVQWTCLKLDSLRFMPVNSENAFGFVDPVNVLRGCHILPWFRGGRIHADGRGISKVANDKHDWCQYRVNR